MDNISQTIPPLSATKTGLRCLLWLHSRMNVTGFIRGEGDAVSLHMQAVAERLTALVCPRQVETSKVWRGRIRLRAFVTVDLSRATQQLVDDGAS